MDKDIKAIGKGIRPTIEEADKLLYVSTYQMGFNDTKKPATGNAYSN